LKRRVQKDKILCYNEFLFFKFNHLYNFEIMKNNQKHIISPLTSPGEVVSVFTSPYLSAEAPAFGEAKGLIIVKINIIDI